MRANHYSKIDFYNNYCYGCYGNYICFMYKLSLSPSAKNIDILCLYEFKCYIIMISCRKNGTKVIICTYL